MDTVNELVPAMDVRRDVVDTVEQPVTDTQGTVVYFLIVHVSILYWKMDRTSEE